MYYSVVYFEDLVNLLPKKVSPKATLALQPRMHGVWRRKPAGVGILSEDTSPEAEEVLIGLLRAKSPVQRLAQMEELVRTGRFLMLTGLRRRRPGWSQQRLLQELGGPSFLQPNPIALLVQVGQILERLGIDYFVTGSIGSIHYGEPRLTNDVDLVARVGLDHASPLYSAVESEFYASLPAIEEAVRRRSCFNLIHLASGFKIDVHVSKERDFDHSRFQRSRPAEGFVVASAEDIVLAKLEWFRRGQEVSDRQWRDILGVLLVQSEHLDYAYLQEWSRRLGVDDLLERARSQIQG